MLRQKLMTIVLIVIFLGSNGYVTGIKVNQFPLTHVDEVIKGETEDGCVYTYWIFTLRNWAVGMIIDVNINFDIEACNIGYNKYDLTMQIKIFDTYENESDGSVVKIKEIYHDSDEFIIDQSMHHTFEVKVTAEFTEIIKLQFVGIFSKYLVGDGESYIDRADDIDNIYVNGGSRYVPKTTTDISGNTVTGTALEKNYVNTDDGITRSLFDEYRIFILVILGIVTVVGFYLRNQIKKEDEDGINSDKSSNDKENPPKSAKEKVKRRMEEVSDNLDDMLGEGD